MAAEKLLGITTVLLQKYETSAF